MIPHGNTVRAVLRKANVRTDEDMSVSTHHKISHILLTLTCRSMSDRPMLNAAVERGVAALLAAGFTVEHESTASFGFSKSYRVTK